MAWLLQSRLFLRHNCFLRRFLGDGYRVPTLPGGHIIERVPHHHTMVGRPSLGGSLVVSWRSWQPRRQLAYITLQPSFPPLGPSVNSIQLILPAGLGPERLRLSFVHPHLSC